MAVQNCIGDAFRGATWVALHNGGGCGWWVGDHPYITSAYELGGWVQKISIFADVQYCIYADVVSLWAKKIQKCADVICGWSQACFQSSWAWHFGFCNTHLTTLSIELYGKTTKVRFRYQVKMSHYLFWNSSFSFFNQWKEQMARYVLPVIWMRLLLIRFKL